VICLYAGASVTLMFPVKAVGWSETPFGRDISVVADNIVFDKGDFGVGIFSHNMHCKLGPTKPTLGLEMDGLVALDL